VPVRYPVPLRPGDLVGVTALGDLGLPVVLDVDCGRVAPRLALVNGALAQLEVDVEVQRLTQTLG
jgi:muramoyltetrapeptide carboxypeptidase